MKIENGEIVLEDEIERLAKDLLRGYIDKGVSIYWYPIVKQINLYCEECVGTTDDIKRTEIEAKYISKIKNILESGGKRNEN